MPAEVIDSKLMPLKKCPLCHGTERKRLFDLDLYGVFECAYCRLRYIDPCLSPEGMQYYYSSDERLLELNPFHRSYYVYGDPSSDSRTVLDFKRTLDALGTSGKKIFDVGCGNGLFLAVAQKRGWKVSGCEPSKSNVALAKSKFGLDIDWADFDRFDPKNEKYDVVSFWDILEHLTDPHAFLQKAVGMLNPGGRIVVGGPHDRSFLRILASFVYRVTVGRVRAPLKKAYLLEHVTYYTVGTMKNLFAKHSFEPQCFFMSSTDLEKYHLAPLEKIMASAVLTAGNLFGLQNRMIAVFRAGV